MLNFLKKLLPSRQVSPEIPDEAREDRLVVLEWAGPRGEVLSIEANVKTYGPDSVGVIGQEGPPPGQTVKVRDGHFVFAAYVKKRLEHEGLFETELAFATEGRRREPRYPTVGEASMRWDKGSYSVRVVEISHGGIQVISPEHASLGNTVIIEGHDLDRVGTVRRCVPGQDGFRIGIEFHRQS